jgi:N-acylneuraminate cytidylyltransferase
MTVCVIPARGGSKRIPRKNVLDFCGKPMIAWPIEVALESGCFDKVVVSTDDDEIAQVALAYGADVPFRRDASLSDDQTTTVPVISDAIKQMNLSAQTPVCCLYATSPFVLAADLQQGLKLLQGSVAPFIMSVTSYAFPIQRALRRRTNGVVEMLNPQHMLTRSQDLEEAWHDAGQFYWAQAHSWTSGKAIFESGAQGLVLPRYRVQDIDTVADWVTAEKMMQARNLGSKE